MPSSAYTRDPTNPVDLLGRPISVGDYVAIATVAYRSASLTVGRIEKLNFRRKATDTYEWIPCPQHAAEKYTVTIEIFQTTAYSSKRTTTLQNVDHVLRLDNVPLPPAKMVNP